VLEERQLPRAHRDVLCVPHLITRPSISIQTHPLPRPSIHVSVHLYACASIYTLARLFIPPEAVTRFSGAVETSTFASRCLCVSPVINVHVRFHVHSKHMNTSIYTSTHTRARPFIHVYVHSFRRGVLEKWKLPRTHVQRNSPACTSTSSQHKYSSI